MPVKKDNQKLYGSEWPEISRSIKERAGWRCECTGQCRSSFDCGHNDGRCDWRQGDLPSGRKRMVVLTVHHVNGRPWDNRPENLLALCEGCHLRMDQAMHQTHAHATRDDKKGLQELFGGKA